MTLTSHHIHQTDHLILALITIVIISTQISHVYYRLHNKFPAQGINDTLWIHAPFSLYHAWITFLLMLSLFAAFTPEKTDDEDDKQPKVYLKVLVFFALLTLQIIASGYIEKFKGDVAGALVIAGALYGIFAAQDDPFIHWTSLFFAVCTSIHIVKPFVKKYFFGSSAEHAPLLDKKMSEKETFKYLESGGDVLQSVDLFDLVKDILALPRDEIINSVRTSQTNSQALTIRRPSQPCNFMPNNHESTLKLVLQDLHNLIKEANAVYEQNPLRIQSLCDSIFSDNLYRNLRRTDLLKNLKYFLPIILYIWKPNELNIDYENVIRALILVETGKDFIIPLVANSPQMFHEFTDILLKLHKYLPQKLKYRIRDMIHNMCLLTDELAIVVRMKLTDLKIFPDLALKLTLDQGGDVPLYLNGILCRNPKWLLTNEVQYETIMTIKQRLLIVVRKLLNDKTTPHSSHRTRFCIVMRCLCGLVCIFKVSFDHNELIDCLNVLRLEELQKEMRGYFIDSKLARIALEIEPDTFDGLGLSKDSQYISFKCFYTMIKGSVFQIGKVDIQPWIYNQIMQATTPIHFQLGPLIKAYAQSIFEGYLGEPSPITKIPENKIFGFFQDNLIEITAAHVLLFYFVLAYNKVVKDMKISCGQQSITIDPQKSAYTPRLTEAIPVRRILFLTERCDNGVAYRNIYPDLLVYITNYYPEIFDIESLLMDEDRRRHESEVYELLEIAVLNFHNTVEKTVSALKCLETIPPEDLYSISEPFLLYFLPKALESNVDVRILESIQQIWLSLYSINPHEITLLFINATRGEDDQNIRYMERDIMLDPSIVFRCNIKIFRCPLIFKIFLRTLRFYTVGSRNRLKRLNEEELNRGKDAHSTQKLEYLINIQETMYLNMLLEICIRNKNEDDKNKGALEEIRVLTFGFLHQIFIENPELLKSLHFAGYSIDLLPLTTNPQKQLFGLNLAGQLCEVWPMTKTYEIAKDSMLPTIKRIVLELREDTLSKEAMQILPLTVLIYNKFQNLQKEVVNLLRGMYILYQH
ncbi:6156_t:CDS:10 [Entrophospora sp. SA101]|nr:6156_t:CDS:10 [Entrophospora sp. SA101]